MHLLTDSIISQQMVFVCSYYKSFCKIHLTFALRMHKILISDHLKLLFLVYEVLYVNPFIISIISDTLILTSTDAPPFNVYLLLKKYFIGGAPFFALSLFIQFSLLYQLFRNGVIRIPEINKKLKILFIANSEISNFPSVLV